MYAMMKRLPISFLLLCCTLGAVAQGVAVDTLVADYGLVSDYDMRPDTVVADPLPMPEIRYGVATVRGQLTSDSTELPRTMALLNNVSPFAPGLTRNDSLWAAVSPEGTFEFRLPVAHTMPVFIGTANKNLMTCYVAAGDTTEITIDLDIERQPKAQRTGYYSHVARGPLADLANELNHKASLFRTKVLYEALQSDYDNHPDLIGSNPLTLLRQLAGRVKWRYDRQKLSPALCQLLQLDDKLCLIGLYEKELFTVPPYIQKRGFWPQKLYVERRKAWYKAVEADRIEAYRQLLDTPRQLLCPSFVGIAHLLMRIPVLYPDYVANEIGAFALKQQLRNYHQLDTLQLQQNLAVLSPAYQQWVAYHADQLNQLMADNAQRTGYRLRDDLPEVAPYHDFELLDRVLQRYRGKTVFVQLWNPVTPSSRQLVRDVMVPLQQAFADADVTWVHLAWHNNHDSWLQQAPQLRGDHYELKTGYQVSAIKRSVVWGQKTTKNADLTKSSYFYAIVTPDGKIAHYSLEKPTLDELRQQLCKYVKTTR